PDYSGTGCSGANALATAVVTEPAPAASETPLQTALFPRTAVSHTAASHKIIPFEQLQRLTTGRTAPPKIEDPHRPANPPRSTPRHQTPVPTGQTMLDFIPAAPSRIRKLGTEVDAQVFCEQPVATPTHRFVAAPIEAALIVL